MQHSVLYMGTVTRAGVAARVHRPISSQVAGSFGKIAGVPEPIAA